jgi:two-component system, LuxR family, response regulator FixJ
MIFIVDDDKAVLKALMLLLRIAGFHAEGFSSAEDFLKQAHITDSDCIILDLSMPGMSGFDLMERLTSWGINPQVIIITAFDDAWNRERARKIKAAAFLTKPVDDQALIDTINWVLQSEKKDKELRQTA